MQLNDFESHPLWQRLTEVERLLDDLRRTDDGQHIDLIDELQTRAAQLRAAHRSRRRLSPLIVPPQLDSVDSPFQALHNSLQSALSSEGPARAQYLTQAIQYAYGASASQGSWPEANPTAADERLDVAVVDELLHRESQLDSHYRARLVEINREVDATSEAAVAVTALVAQAKADLAALVKQATASVEAEKARIGNVIDDGQSTIASFEAVLDRSLKEWEKERNQTFESRLGNVRKKQDQLLQNSEEEYEKLQRTVADHQTLVQADSADRLAKHYEAESRAARTGGSKMNRNGFILLIVAAVPLLLVVLQPILGLFGVSQADPSWQSVVARFGVAALLVAAGTVAIRLGSADLRRAADYKRLAMELRTMGPFLSDVKDPESVDQARLDLVNRTFGQAYAPSKEERLDDAVPVSVLQQLLTLLTKTVSR